MRLVHFRHQGYDLIGLKIYPVRYISTQSGEVGAFAGAKELKRRVHG